MRNKVKCWLQGSAKKVESPTLLIGMVSILGGTFDLLQNLEPDSLGLHVFDQVAKVCSLVHFFVYQ